jgi:uncharacterized protein YejL (UPF0352 family)
LFHTAGFTVSLGNTADTDVPAISDDILTILNNHFVLRRPLDLIAAASMNTNLDRAKIASPSMRQIASPFIRSVIGALVPGSNPNMWLLNDNPFRIPALEEIQVQATSTVAGPQQHTTVVWLRDTHDPIPFGNVIPLRFTSTTAAAANAWSTVPITFSDTLPSGRFAVALSEVVSANAIAHRWIFSGQEYRPGFLSFTSAQNRHPYAIAKGQFGSLGTFRSVDLPRLQVLCNGADAAHTGWLHVVRIGDL